MNNVILIDTSYTLFHRYFAILRWLSLAESEIYKDHINDVNYNWLENDIFAKKYEKMYLEGIIKLIGKKIFKNSTVIFCMDTPKEQLWRTEIKCNYKADRFDMTKKTNFIPTFNYTYNTIIPNLLKNNPNFHKIRINKLEADDIIATICKQINPNIKVYLLSGDEDFLQLGRPNLYFINFKTKKPKELTVHDASLLLHKKLLLGDKSDCIPSIFPPRFSSKIKKLLVNSIIDFNNFINNLNTDKEIINKYKHNDKLINFNHIPNELILLVNKELTNIINKN